MSDSLDRPELSNVATPDGVAAPYFLLSDGNPKTNTKAKVTAVTVDSMLAGYGSVRSVAATGANGIIITGSPITTSGALAISVDAAALQNHLGLGSAAYRGLSNSGGSLDGGKCVTYLAEGAISTTGPNAYITTTGNNASIATSGDSASIYTTGVNASIYTIGFYAEILTSGDYAHIYTNGADAYIFTTGSNATIYTSGAGGSIFTEGANAPIYTLGVNAFIQTRSTFKLNNGVNTTTIVHSPTANRQVQVPDRDCVLTGIPLGPFANDAAAATGGVPIGGLYYQASGATFTRLT